MKTNYTRVVLGGALASLLLVFYPFLNAPGALPGIASMLISLVFFGAFAAALMLLGVVKKVEAPANLLPALVFGTAMLLYRVGSQMTELSSQQWIWSDIASLGVLLLMLGWACVIHSLVTPKGFSGRFDAGQAAFWFALVMLGCTHPYVLKEIGAVRVKADAMGTLLMLGLVLLCGFLLIPFLRKSRVGGLWMAVLGALMLVIYVLVYHTPLTESIGGARTLLSILVAPKNHSLAIGLFVCGLWCWSPWAGRTADK